ncbi:hypothetical protein [Actinomadura citrea]|uniref:Uncharacterized protein n=1 Tax=Actinomadura citrea TaxID=46158 RepID=A0A7Y9G8J1_9ACTN|nr:hypothetical protein [Actinomadura citrea]NYE11882.1 hypothetical protein [Actinomadura citrea]GGT90682.1 hypothetical protein GCM10010177_57370 [Actinomadura citrea]
MRDVPGPDDDETGGALALAAKDPEGARAQILRTAARRPAASLPDYFSAAAGAFARAGFAEQAAFCLGRAGEVEESNARLLDLAPDTARAQRVLVELVPLGAITASALHGHLKRLARHDDAAAAHAWAREAVCAFFDAGAVPYPNVVADLLPVARSAGVDEAGETDFVAERLLRGGLLPRAPLPLWEALDAALRRLAGRPELLDLLIEARPDGELYADPGPRAEHHRRWLLLLGLVGAGRRLPREWFTAAGPLPAVELMRLAADAGDRLFPAPGRWFDPAADPVVGRSAPDPLAFTRRKVQAPHWTGESDDLPRFLAQFDEGAPSARERLDAYVRGLGHYDNVDYPSQLRTLWARGTIRRALSEDVAQWREECAAGDLLGLEVALPRLAPLAEAAAATPAAGALAGLEITDPVDALWHALRAGLPEELRFPAVEDSPVTVVLHDDLLTLGVAGKRVEVHGPAGPVHRADLPHGTGAYPWYDGADDYLSRLNGDRAETFRAAAPGKLEVPADGRWRWPRTTAAVALTFPGATAPTQVVLDRGILRLIDGEGRATLRVRYSPVQRGDAVMPPPGFWPHLSAADAEGSAALRGLARDAAARLVDAALVHRRELDAELGRVLPEITDTRLLEGVAALVLRAAACLLDVLRLRDALRLPQPDGLPERVRGGGLRAGRLGYRRPAIRYLAEVLVEAAETGPAYDTPHPLGRIDLPTGARGVYFAFGTLGGEALLAALPWQAGYHRAKAADLLGAWGGTPWGDGSGRWRRLWFGAQATQDPEGQLWRTPNGAMVILSWQARPHKDSVAVEYSPDGVFRDFTFPGWHHLHPPRPQGWGGADRIARYLRLLDERGPAPYDVAAVRRLAEGTGLPVSSAASAAYGYPFTVGREKDRARLPADVAALYTDPETGEHAGRPRSWQLDDALRQLLMPADPEDLWITGLDVDGAVAWWDAVGRDLGL